VKVQDANFFSSPTILVSYLKGVTQENRTLKHTISDAKSGM